MPIDESKLKDYIDMSGHSVSIKASNMLSKNNWYVKNAPRYFNEYTKETNEIDIYAEKDSAFVKGKDVLLIECKKSREHPWVFFKQGNTNTNVYSLNIAEQTGGAIYDDISRRGLFQKHYYYGAALSSYYLVGLEKPNNRANKEAGRTIYNATRQALGALQFYMYQLSDFLNSNKYTLNIPYFYYSIIVLDGELYETDASEITSINKTNHVSLCVEMEIDKPSILKLMSPDTVHPLFSKPYVVDIVKLDYFDEFLKKSFNPALGNSHEN